MSRWHIVIGVIIDRYWEYQLIKHHTLYVSPESANVSSLCETPRILQHVNDVTRTSFRVDSPPTRLLFHGLTRLTYIKNTKDQWWCSDAFTCYPIRYTVWCYQTNNILFDSCREPLDKVKRSSHTMNDSSLLNYITRQYARWLVLCARNHGLTSNNFSP